MKHTAPTGRWTRIDYLESRMKLPTVECCYVVYFGGQLKYIGSTNNLRNGLSGHAFRFSYGKSFITPWGEFPLPLKVEIKFKPSRRYGDWLMLEARLIKRLLPAFNQKMKGRAK